MRVVKFTYVRRRRRRKRREERGICECHAREAEEKNRHEALFRFFKYINTSPPLQILSLLLSLPTYVPWGA